ncbi:MAG: conserved hypothetical alanine rich protein [Frankiales bacterium]|nr:conserved hypothetical alanine rich protein [Frankiales bacterium]
MSEEGALTDLLAAEHAAIYGYGVLGARLDDKTRELALRACDAHRSSRNVLDTALRARSLTPPTTAASYDVVVTGRADALQLAQRIETDLGVLWRDLVGTTDDPALRALGAKGLQASAVQVVVWRRVAHLRPLTEAFPGQASPR